MSIFSKYLWDITVPAGGWNFATNLVTSTIPAGVYDILELGARLEIELDTDHPALEWTVTVSSIGIMTVSADGAFTSDWANTDDDLEAVIGSDGTEAVSANALTMAGQHTYGYYPGLMSWGYTVHKGTSNTNPRRWSPAWDVIRQISGSNSITAIGPATASNTMELQYGQITVEEEEDETTGLKAFWNQCVASDFKFYPDRALGTCATPGTQDTDYYLCKFADRGEPRVRDGRHPNLCTFSMILNKEP